MPFLIVSSCRRDGVLEKQGKKKKGKIVYTRSVRLRNPNVPPSMFDRFIRFAPVGHAINKADAG